METDFITITTEDFSNLYIACGVCIGILVGVTFTGAISFMLADNAKRRKE